MFRSVGDTPGDHGIAIGSVQEPVIPSAIGKIKTAIGLVTIARASAIVAQPAVGDLVYEGDLIETGIDGLVGIVFVDGTTFHLYANARMVLKEFIYGAEKSSNSALLQVIKGVFSFFAGKVASTGRLISILLSQKFKARHPLPALGAWRSASSPSVLFGKSKPRASNFRGLMTGRFSLHTSCTAFTRSSTGSASTGSLIVPKRN
jgi:hypothetical protein